MPYLNFILAGAAYWANEYWFQGFCQPVEWAAWVLAVSTGAFLLWPFAKRVPGLNYLLLFLMGVHFTVCVYCALFINPLQLLSILLMAFLVFPLLLWVPVVFAVQALNRVHRSALPGARVVFGLGVLALLPVQLWAELRYREVETAVARLPWQQRHQVASLVGVVPRNYMAERLAGALFKYHNSPEFVFDGWRPPLHDPLVNICLWSRSGGGNPLLIDSAAWRTPQTSADTQAAFYHQLFPDLPIKADCTCNHTHDGESYLEWQPWLNSRAADARLRLKRQELLKQNNPLGL
ncbi:hypothetical protein [Hymenobacter convexus]|uniref:hypothetical protein n=1 Tax=Hymenobacter sp. CA1UV-4 TaxID=3063782 RepID=UPI0027134D0E|nr:hypothetical protein [Hymenobacter sp. CA1UV-4]MDO7851151.1 hypothetical protein [Hymenobacter sp. CA1UV-4]